MKLAILLLVLALFTVSRAQANIIPALEAGRAPDISILGESSLPSSLGLLLEQAGSGPVILLPMFTRCSGSCPILIHQLLAALAGAQRVGPYRVVVIAFDPLETDESLRLYRAQDQLPADWKLVRAQESEIRELLGFFRYNVMNQDGTLIHPNEIFLLDQGLNWRWTLVGEDWTRRDLEDAIRRTRSPGLVARITARPERLAWAGFAAALLGIGLPIGWMIGRRPAREVQA